MSASPTVSVAVPFYNSEDTLLDAIRSVFAQTFDDWELMLTDDGSTDGSLAIALSVKDPRVRVFSDGRNLKQGARRNQMNREAAGNYIAVLDADDLMHPDRLEKQVDFLGRHPDVDVVGTLMYQMDSQYRVYSISGGGLAAGRFEPRETLDRPVLMHGTTTGRAQWFRENPYDETFARSQDSELWCRTWRHSRFAVIEEPLYFRLLPDIEAMLGKHVRQMHFRRRILWTYGPECIGLPRTLLRVACTYLSSASNMAVGIFAKLDRRNVILTGRRSRKELAMAPQQREEAQAAIEKVMATTVPMIAPPDCDEKANQ